MNAIVFNFDISSWGIASVRDMEDAFNNATMFNQDLCGWSDTFPYESNVFMNSGCKHQETPVNQSGTFCASDCIPTSSPSNMPAISPSTISPTSTPFTSSPITANPSQRPIDTSKPSSPREVSHTFASCVHDKLSHIITSFLHIRIKVIC